MAASPAHWLGGGLRWARARWLLLAIGLVIAYFGYHAVHGQRGLFAWIDRNRELEAVKVQLADVVRERTALERRAEGLQPDHLDRDVVEGELRNLGYIRPDEVIVLTPVRP